MDAFEAGLWLFWVLPDRVLAVPRPAIRILDNQLHCADGPAVRWPGGAQYFFWRGIQVSADVVLHPERLAARQALTERNAEVRRVMVERIGHDRFITELDLRPVHQDETGSLYRVGLAEDEPLVIVHVTNATPEPDGSRRRFFLRVPPEMERARQAVAWTFGLPEREYRPLEES